VVASRFWSITVRSSHRCSTHLADRRGDAGGRRQDLDARDRGLRLTASTPGGCALAKRRYRLLAAKGAYGAVSTASRAKGLSMLEHRGDIGAEDDTQAAADLSDALDAALEMTFPASDPVAVSSAAERVAADVSVAAG